MKKQRRSIRLKEFDYAKSNFYFITICIQDRRHDFGEIKNGKMLLSAIGEIAKSFWKEIPMHFPNVVIDEYIFMPDHMHGILYLREPPVRENKTVRVEYIQPRRMDYSIYQNVQKNSIPSIIRSYKAAVTRWCMKNQWASFQWQRNYYEHIIRNEESYYKIINYIQKNPESWKST